MKRDRLNWLLLLGAVLLAVYPLMTVRSARSAPGQKTVELFSGADSQAEAVIGQIAPDYQPWAAPLWKPPSSEIESLLFSLQAAIGAGFIGYVVGRRRERRAWQSSVSHAD